MAEPNGGQSLYGVIIVLLALSDAAISYWMIWPDNFIIWKFITFSLYFLPPILICDGVEVYAHFFSRVGLWSFDWLRDNRILLILNITLTLFLVIFGASYWIFDNNPSVLYKNLAIWPLPLQAFLATCFHFYVKLEGCPDFTGFSHPMKAHHAYVFGILIVVAMCCICPHLKVESYFETMLANFSCAVVGMTVTLGPLLRQNQNLQPYSN